MGGRQLLCSQQMCVDCVVHVGKITDVLTVSDKMRDVALSASARKDGCHTETLGVPDALVTTVVPGFCDELCHKMGIARTEYCVRSQRTGAQQIVFAWRPTTRIQNQHQTGDTPPDHRSTYYFEHRLPSAPELRLWLCWTSNRPSAFEDMVDSPFRSAITQLHQGESTASGQRDKQEAYSPRYLSHR